MTSDDISEVINNKYKNTIFKYLPRILIKLSLENDNYYKALINKKVNKEILIDTLDHITSIDEMESKIILKLKEMELI